MSSVADTAGEPIPGGETHTSISRILAGLGGKVACSARYLQPPSHSETVIDINGSEVMPAASLAKLPVAVELFRRADLGLFGLDERVDTSEEPRVGGGGVLDYLDPSTQLTFHDLCFLMIAVSDNTAANFLLDFLGMGEINETLNRIHIEKTRLARHFMDMAARVAHRDNVTTAADMVSLLSLIRGSALPGAPRLRDMLAAQQCAEDLLAWLPEGTQLAHKTGSLDGIFHDAGILNGPAGGCVFAIMTSEQSDISETRRAVGRILRVLWNNWCAAA